MFLHILQWFKIYCFQYGPTIIGVRLKFSCNFKIENNGK